MIRTDKITKIYGKQIAVKELSININEGVFFGLLGPNGAGKTTTIQMLSDLLVPTSGTVYINNEIMDRNNNEIKKSIGLVSQHFSLQREMNAFEILKLHGMMHKMKLKDIKTRTEELINFAGLEKDAKKTVNKLSGGNKRKLMIIRSVMHQPKILFLDEPTVGLDANIRRSIWNLLKKLKNDGMTCILTTHYMEEAGSLCDELAFMAEGEIIAQDTPSGFMSQIDPFVVEVFDGETTNYSYFKTREDAANYVLSLSQNSLIRETNLEDVYVKFTSKENDINKIKKEA